MQIFLSIVIWIILGALTAHFAQQRGRDPYIWFAIGMVLGILGLFLAFFLPAVKEENPPTEIIIPVSDHPAFLPMSYRSLDWFYLINDKEQVGPVSFEKIKDLSNSLEEDFYVWCEGMDDWHRVSEVGSKKSEESQNPEV